MACVHHFTLYSFVRDCLLLCIFCNGFGIVGIAGTGQKGLCRDRRERASRECTHKTQMSTLHQWQMGTIPHANQMCSIIRRLLHEFFKLENNDFLRHKFQHMSRMVLIRAANNVRCLPDEYCAMCRFVCCEKLCYEQGPFATEAVQPPTKQVASSHSTRYAQTQLVKAGHVRMCSCSDLQIKDIPCHVFSCT